MVQFGPADYSMSIGLPGQWTHPAVREAERFTIETALKKGIAARAEIGHPDQAKRYLDMGVRHFCIGWDVAILFEWFEQSGQAMREIFSGAADNAARPATRATRPIRGRRPEAAQDAEKGPSAEVRRPSAARST